MIRRAVLLSYGSIDIKSKPQQLYLFHLRWLQSRNPQQRQALQNCFQQKEGLVKHLDKDINMHVDLRDEPEQNPEGQQHYPSNYGPHISIYIRDIRSTYERAK